MFSIKSNNTSLEKTFRKALRMAGLSYKLNYGLVGKPDIVILQKRMAIFVDSCFWHNCVFHRRLPKTNAKYWKTKLKRNSRRDAEVNKFLKSKGWNVVRIWEHDMKKNMRKCVNRVAKNH